MKVWQKNLILILLVIALAAVPLWLLPNAEFGGADGAAEEAIAAIDPDYEPWASNLLEPPGGETESLLFALQAALGAGVVFFAFGYLLARKKYRPAADR